MVVQAAGRGGCTAVSKLGCVAGFLEKRRGQFDGRVARLYRLMLRNPIVVDNVALVLGYHSLF